MLCNPWRGCFFVLPFVIVAGDVLTVRMLLVLCLILSPGAAWGQEVFDPVDSTDDDSQTGIAVGAKVPDFSAVDQNGKTWDFESLTGPKGLVLLFHRSADW